MNAPVSPTVSLENLAHVADVPQVARLAPKRRARAWVAASAVLVGTAAWLVWRGAPRLGGARRSGRGVWIAGGVGLAALALARWQLQRLFTEEPSHEVESELGGLEIRRYPSFRVAETTVDASWDRALDVGFGRLFRFLVGGNDGKKKMAMTSPVLGTGDGNGFRFAFVLPKGELPPLPDDDRISVTEMPARRIAAFRFHGRYNAASIEAKKRELCAALGARGLKPRGEAYFAGYDPPTTLPLLRRNELWVELEG